MNLVFLGGGSYRIPSIIRGALGEGLLDGGQVRLVDRVVDRVRTVGHLIERCPEFAGRDCRVSWGDDLDAALDGADALYVTMAVGSPAVLAASGRASAEHGFLSSDQLSLTGSMLGLTAGPAILDFARRMEQRCPDARLLCFANPVPIYAGLVCNHTAIDALGLCAGFTNHRWDLPRLMGLGDYDDRFELEVAGVNHLSYIVGGTHAGRSFYEVMEPHLQNFDAPVPPLGPEHRHVAEYVGPALRLLREIYRLYGVVVFSTEGDGMAHLRWDRVAAEAREKAARAGANAGAGAKLDRDSEQARNALDRKMRELADAAGDAAFWRNDPPRSLAADTTSVSIMALRAMAGQAQRIVASRPNAGAIAGIKDRTVVEYSMRVDRATAEPTGRFELPDGLHGLTADLALHQTMMGDAIATEDPRLLAAALLGYPMQRHTAEARSLSRTLLKVHEPQIPAWTQRAADFL